MMDKYFELKISIIFSDEDDAYNTYNSYIYDKGFGIREGYNYYNTDKELRRYTFMYCCEGSPKTSLHVEKKLVCKINKRCSCLARIKF